VQDRGVRRKKGTGTIRRKWEGKSRWGEGEKGDLEEKK